MFLFWRNQIVKLILLGVFLALFVCHLSTPINLTAVDIGRHLKNGELILGGNAAVLYKNFYSYTYPDYTFINHHWLGGVIFYLVHKCIGWEGLSYFYLGLMALAFFFFYLTARRYASFGVVLLLSALVLPIMVDRREIRPEGFSVLFIGIYFYVLTLFQEKRLSLKNLLFMLVPIQVLWVNIHIFFFIGPLLALAFCENRRQWWVVLVLLLVNVINPSGLAGALTPLNGFSGFNYSLAENQSVLFMLKRFGNDPYLYELIMLGLGVVGLVVWFLRYYHRWVLGVLFLLMLMAGFKAVRLMAPLAFIWIVLVSMAVGKNNKVNILAAVIAMLYLGFMLIKQENHLNVGLLPNVNRSAQFFKELGIKGPVFSNYDIGGYLIYHLYPQERVFVDNRQEAFPSGFFKDTYIPMQEDKERWQAMAKQYDFQTIYFYRHDLTPWGQGFLVGLISDQEWAPVFVDDYTIIFVKRGGVNQAVTNQFELPKTMFGVTKASP